MAKLKPGDKIGPFPYQIVKQLGKGQGNMSDVYLAAEGGRPNAPLVVLKISRSNSAHSDFFTDTIYNEAERLRQLSHPGIVHLLPIKTDSASMSSVPYVANASLPGRPWFLVLEHLTGGALDDMLSKEKRLPQVLALRIAQQLAATLDYIHRCGQVHLDIKPENILFRRELTPDTLPDPVLIDFGIARNVGQEGLEARTLHYSPPERVLLHKTTLPIDLLAKPAPSMDVYSLGVVLYQMLTGRRPYDGHNDKRISSAIINGNPTKPSVYASDLDRDVEAIVLQAMEKDPTARPTAGEMAQRLEVIAVRKAYSEPQPGAPSAAGSRHGRQSRPHEQSGGGEGGRTPAGQYSGQRSSSRPGGPPQRAGLLVAGGVTLVGLALVAALVFGVGLPASAGPTSDNDGAGSGAGAFADGAATWWQQVAGMLPWLGGGDDGDDGGGTGSGPLIIWQTATAAAAIDTPTPMPPTSTPVPPHPTATYTLEPTSTAAVRNTNTPTLTVLPTVPPTSTPALVESTAAEVALFASPTTALTTALTTAPTATATPTRVPPTSTPVAKGAATAAPAKTAAVQPQAQSQVQPQVQPAAGGSGGLSTPVPDRPTNTPRPPTPTAAAVAKDAAAATRPPATATPAKDAAPFDPSQATVRLLEPADGHTGHGAITFRWETPYQLQENQAFEPIFWRAGGDPMRDGRGYGGTTRGTSMTINWDEVNAAPDGYQWGVLLVEMNPYKRIHYMGGGSGFQFTGPDGGDSGEGSVGDGSRK